MYLICNAITYRCSNINTTIPLSHRRANTSNDMLTIMKACQFCGFFGRSLGSQCSSGHVGTRKFCLQAFHYYKTEVYPHTQQ